MARSSTSGAKATARGERPRTWEMVDLRDSEPRRSERAQGPLDEDAAIQAAANMCAFVIRHNPGVVWNCRGEDGKQYDSEYPFGVRPYREPPPRRMTVLVVNGATGAETRYGC